MAVRTRITIETTRQRQVADVLSANELIRGIRQKSFEFGEDLKMITASSPRGKSITFRPEQNDRWEISFEPSAGMERMDAELQEALREDNQELPPDDVLFEQLDAWLSGS